MKKDYSLGLARLVFDYKLSINSVTAAFSLQNSHLRMKGMLFVIENCFDNIFDNISRCDKKLGIFAIDFNRTRVLSVILI